MLAFRVDLLRANLNSHVYKSMDPAKISEVNVLFSYKVLDHPLKYDTWQIAKQKARLPALYWQALEAEELRHNAIIDSERLHPLLMAHLQFAATLLLPFQNRLAGGVPRHLRARHR